MQKQKSINRGKIKEYLKDWTTYEKAWVIIFTLTILGLSEYWKESMVGVIASLTGIWCVVLVAKGKIENYYVGIINVIAYAYVAWGWKYYGEVMLNIIYYLPAQFVGIVLWNRHKSNGRDDSVKVKVMTNKTRVTWVVISISGIIAYSYVLEYLGGGHPLIDSITTTLSVIAMVLMILRYVEQWEVWVVINIASIYLWYLTLVAGGNDISILIMWIAYLVNSIFGLTNWTKMYKEQCLEEVE